MHPHPTSYERPRATRCLSLSVTERSRPAAEMPFAALAVRPELSPAERRVAVLLPTHLSRGQIGVKLYLSLNTVKTHMRRIYRALDVSTREDAVAVLRRYGYVDPAGR